MQYSHYDWLLLQNHDQRILATANEQVGFREHVISAETDNLVKGRSNSVNVKQVFPDCLIPLLFFSEFSDATGLYIINIISKRNLIFKKCFALGNRVRTFARPLLLCRSIIKFK